MDMYKHVVKHRYVKTLWNINSHGNSSVKWWDVINEMQLFKCISQIYIYMGGGGGVLWLLPQWSDTFYDTRLESLLPAMQELLFFPNLHRPADRQTRRNISILSLGPWKKTWVYHPKMQKNVTRRRLVIFIFLNFCIP